MNNMYSQNPFANASSKNLDILLFLARLYAGSTMSLRNAAANPFW